MQLTYFCIAPHSTHGRLEQYPAESFPASAADFRHALMLAGAVLHHGQTSQLLNLLGIVKAADVTNLRQKACYRHHADAGNRQQLICSGNLLQQLLQHCIDLVKLLLIHLVLI